jgi:hypothetical protein
MFANVYKVISIYLQVAYSAAYGLANLLFDVLLNNKLLISINHNGIMLFYCRRSKIAIPRLN